MISCTNNHEHNILNNYYAGSRFQSQQSSNTPSTNTYSHQAHEQT